MWATVQSAPYCETRTGRSRRMKRRSCLRAFWQWRQSSENINSITWEPERRSVDCGPGPHIYVPRPKIRFNWGVCGVEKRSAELAVRPSLKKLEGFTSSTKQESLGPRFHRMERNTIVLAGNNSRQSFPEPGAFVRNSRDDAAATDLSKPATAANVSRRRFRSRMTNWPEDWAGVV